MLIFTLYSVFFLLLVFLYFIIASKFNIIDKPNERSSHRGVVIRGAGIIFPIAFLIPLFVQYEQFLSLYLLAIGLFLISFISFIDDIKTLNNKVRILFHFTAVALLMQQLNAFNNFWYVIPFTFIITVGVINAYNFMDGINGITALYSFIALLFFYFIQQNEISVLPNEVFYSLFASIIVFSFFNLRKKAKCFSGDVGSIAIAFILSYLILDKILHTGELKWLLVLGIYGLDSVATIILRLFRKENIFKAHRSHFYQFLANDLKWSHVNIAIIYSIIQAVLNYFVYAHDWQIVILVFVLITFIYVYFRMKLEGFNRLFKQYN